MNLVETGKRIMVETGASSVLWLLIALSIVSFALILERAWASFRRRGDIATLRSRLCDALEAGDFGRARDEMTGLLHPAAVVARTGLLLERAGVLPTPKQASEAMEAEMIAQKGQLESGLGLLATLGNNAPFIGLFGTVIGIVAAFDALGQGATSQIAGDATASGSVAASLGLMSAIGEALVATAVGIGVALPAVAGFNYFSRASKKSLAGAEILMKEILACLEAASVAGDIVDKPAPTRSVVPAKSENSSRAREEIREAFSHGI